MSPMNHVDRRLLPPILIPNCSHKQSASRIIAWLKMWATNPRSWFKWHIDTELSSVITADRNSDSLYLSQCLQVWEFLRLSRCLEFLQFLHLSDCSYCSDCSYFYCFYAIRRVTILVLITNEQSRSTYIRILSSKNNPSLRYLYLNQRRYYFVWLYKVLEIHNL